MKALALRFIIMVGCWAHFVHAEGVRWSWSSDLDFSSVYGGLNAGEYALSVTISPTEELEIDNVEVMSSVFNDDGILKCSVWFSFPVGTMSLSIQSKVVDFKHRTSASLMAAIGHEEEGDSCQADGRQFYGQQSGWTYTARLKGIPLPVQAPRGYTSVEVLLHPFKWGLEARYTILPGTRAGTVKIKGPGLALAQALGELRARDLMLGYYVYALDDRGLLSLALGELPMMP